MRSEGQGIRATGRVISRSGGSIINWEQRLSKQIEKWSPPAPAGGKVTLEGDAARAPEVSSGKKRDKTEVSTQQRRESSPPEASEGWTIHFIERTSRYWVNAQAGLKNAELFGQGVKEVWDWAKPSEGIRWFTDGERRYGKTLWKLASVFLPQCKRIPTYPYWKVWREGLEVAIKVKGSQGKPHIEWLSAEHPFTAISPKSDVHKEGVRGKLPPAHFRANHNEAQNSSLRRRSSAYHRRQNHYAKVVNGLQRALDVQRLVHNWVRPHWGLANNQTPAMAMGYLNRPIFMTELLSSRGFQYITL